MTTFFDLFPYESFFLWVWCGGAVYYFLCYHMTHRLICSRPTLHKTVARNMSETRFKQQVRNMSIAPFLFASVVGCAMSFSTGSTVPLLRFQGLVTGCYVFEVLELLWNRRYTLATHHVVAVALYMVCWFYGEVPHWVSLNKMSLFLGSTFAADVAHHISGVLIHFVGKEKRFVRYFLMFSACCYAGRMACALYCGVYALLFLRGVMGTSLVLIALFCLTVDRFMWFPNILRAYGIGQPQQQHQSAIKPGVLNAPVTTAAPLKPAFQLNRTALKVE